MLNKIDFRQLKTARNELEVRVRDFEMDNFVKKSLNLVPDSNNDAELELEEFDSKYLGRLVDIAQNLEQINRINSEKWYERILPNYFGEFELYMPRADNIVTLVKKSIIYESETIIHGTIIMPQIYVMQNKNIAKEFIEAGVIGLIDARKIETDQHGPNTDVYQGTPFRRKQSPK